MSLRLRQEAILIFDFQFRPGNIPVFPQRGPRPFAVKRLGFVHLYLNSASGRLCLL